MYAAPSTSTRPAVLDGLRRWVSGRVVGPADPGWNLARRAWNLQVEQQPAAVVDVRSVADAVAAVQVARDHGLAVTVQPRGHGATGALDGAVLLRPTGLDELRVDPATRTARVGAAVRWQLLNEALTGTGLTGLAGSTGDTSVVGLTLGGGLSWFGRRYGLAANRVRAVELVDADARHRRVTADSDPDLFWALRGGGGDFGVVTALELDLLPAPLIHGGRLTWPVEHAEVVLAAFTETTAAAPEELTVWAWLLNLPDVTVPPSRSLHRWSVAVDVTYLGAGPDAERYLRPLRAATSPPSGSLGTVPLAGLGAIAAEPTEPTPILDGAAMLHTVDAATAEALLAAVAPGRPSPLAVVEIRHLDGSLGRPAPGHGALGHLPEPYSMVCGGPVVEPASAPELQACIDRLDAALARFGSGRRPPNFGHAAADIYPPDVLAQLQQVKRQRDPDGVIRSNRPVLAGSIPG
jgi:hypothetical protein